VKKPYKKPVPKVYGNIRAMTNANPSPAGTFDGQIALGTQLKTH
jgi:hypothetical protein